MIRTRIVKVLTNGDHFIAINLCFFDLAFFVFLGDRFELFRARFVWKLDGLEPGRFEFLEHPKRALESEYFLRVLFDRGGYLLNVFVD